LLVVVSPLECRSPRSVPQINIDVFLCVRYADLRKRREVDMHIYNKTRCMPSAAIVALWQKKRLFVENLQLPGRNCFNLSRRCAVQCVNCNGRSSSSKVVNFSNS